MLPTPLRSETDLSRRHEEDEEKNTDLVPRLRSRSAVPGSRVCNKSHPLFMNSPPDLYASEYRGQTNIPAHYIYKGGRVVALNVPRTSLEQVDKTAVLVVTTPQCEMTAYTWTGGVLLWP
jgi:hypothetical protein